MQTWQSGFRRYTLFVCLCIGILAGCGGTKNLMESQTDDELFAQGLSYYKEADYAKALPYFLYVKEHFIRSPHAGLTRFYAGECYVAAEKYEDAAGEYQSFLTFFPNDPNAPAAQYQLGVSYSKQSRGADRDQTMIRKALKELRKVKANYPAAETYITKAEDQIRETRDELARHEFQVAAFYRKTKHYVSANRRLDYLLREYPESDLAGDALFYQGLNYLALGEPENAKAAFSQFLQKYPAHREAASAQKELVQLGVPNAPQPLKAPEPPASQRSAIKGYVVTVREKTVTTNLIRDDGIREGMVLEVHRNEQLIGTLRITEIQDGFSAAHIETTVAGMSIQAEDKVCCPKIEK